MFKKVVIIFTALSFALTGCLGQDYISNTTRNNSPPQNDSQLPSVDNSRNDKLTHQDSKLLKNIDTTKSPFEKGYYDYEGSINKNILLRMSIYPLGTDMVGSYFYQKQKQEIVLKGRAGKNTLVLYEYDDKGKTTGVFQGTIEDVDKIQGTWMSPDGSRSYPFVLSLKANLSGADFGKRYAGAGVTENDQNVEKFASRIQDDIIKGDKVKLAEQISFPIMVKVNGKVTKIDKADFIKNYDGIINPEFKQTISNAFTKYLFANYLGVMFGSGMYNMWISQVKPTSGNSRLMITAINN